MTRGRIADGDRPVLDFDYIPDVETLGTVAKTRGPAKRSIADVHPKVIAIVKKALGLPPGQGIPVPMPDEPRAIELGRQLRSYGRMHTPELTVNTTVQEVDNTEAQRVEYHVIVTAVIKQTRPKVDVNAPKPDGDYQHGRSAKAPSARV